MCLVSRRERLVFILNPYTTKLAKKLREDKGGEDTLLLRVICGIPLPLVTLNPLPMFPLVTTLRALRLCEK